MKILEFFNIYGNYHVPEIGLSASFDFHSQNESFESVLSACSGLAAAGTQLRPHLLHGPARPPASCAFGIRASEGATAASREANTKETGASESEVKRVRGPGRAEAAAKQQIQGKTE